MITELILGCVTIAAITIVIIYNKTKSKSSQTYENSTLHQQQLLTDENDGGSNRESDVSDQEKSEENVSDQEKSEENVSDQELREETISDHELSEENVSDQELREETICDHELSEENVSDQGSDRIIRALHKKPVRALTALPVVSRRNEGRVEPKLGGSSIVPAGEEADPSPQINWPPPPPPQPVDI